MRNTEIGGDAVSTAGSPVGVTTLDGAAGESGHTHPAFLPDGRHFLYFVSAGATPRGVYLASIEGGDRRQLVEGAGNATFADGFLLFPRGTTLFAQPFDTVRLSTRGDAAVVVESIDVTPGGTAQLSVSDTGVLIYRAGSPASQLTWFDRSGKQLGPVGDVSNYWDVELSPDGRYVSVSDHIDSPLNRDILAIDLKRNASNRLTSAAGHDYAQVWSPDGKRLAFASNRRGTFDVYVKSLEGAGPEEVLLQDNTRKFPQSWSSTGYLLYIKSEGSAGGNDLWAYHFGDKRALAFMATPADEQNGQFSHDGRWVAYTSTDVRGSNVFVAPFPGPGRPVPISTRGGNQPRWGPGDRELFYVANNTLMVVALVQREAQLDVTPSSALFELPPFGSRRRYAVSGDGQRFLVGGRANPIENPPTLVINWSAGIAR